MSDATNKKKDDGVTVRTMAWEDMQKLPTLAPCLVQVLDAHGEVDLLGFSGRYADKPIWDVLHKAGVETDIPHAGFQGRFWRVSKSSQAGVVQKLSRAAKGWPWLTLSIEGRIVPDRLGTKAFARVARRAVVGRCGESTFQMFDARDPGAAEFASVQPWSHLAKVPGRKGGILLRGFKGAQPALPDEISADPQAPQRELPMPTARLRRRGWIMDLVLDGDKLAIAVTMATTRMPVKEKGSWRAPATMSSATSFPVAEWPTWRAWLQASGIAWDAAEFDPDDLWGEVRFDEARIPGWMSPVSTGASLREFQKDGVRFVMSRHGRALLADDMGLGKTAQAIATAAAMKAGRIMILSPAVVKSVWYEEIKKWDGVSDTQAEIHVLDGAHDRPRQGCKWLVASYDQVVARAETWRAESETEFKAVAALVKKTVGFAEDEDEDDLRPRRNETEKKIKFSQPLRADVVELVLAGLTAESALKWSKMHSRLQGELLQALQEWAPDLLVLDEAHRVKSADAKRTSAAIALSAAAGGCLAMSGTPIQNNTNEPAVLLHVIDPAAYHEVRREKISIDRIKALLKPVMLRRRKDEVLKELPPLTEQVVHIKADRDEDDDDLDDLFAFGRSLEFEGIKPKDWAADAPAHIRHLALAWSAGTQLSKFEMIRARLGEAKAHASMALDFIKDALENKGCLVVFTAHHVASDALAASIRDAGWKVEVADGRTSLPRRAQLVSDFQESRLDCLVCGMEAMGEGVTLHRADMVVFLELAYKPSTLRQARDRLHRIGQTSNVQAVYLLSDHPLDTFLERMVLGKAELVGRVLTERVHVLGEDRGDASITSTVPGAMSHGEFCADESRTPAVSNGESKPLHETVSNGEAATISEDSNGDDGAFVADKTKAHALSNGELLPDIVSNGELPIEIEATESNGEVQTVSKRARAVLSDEDRAARQKESKRKWKAAHPEQQTDHSRALAAERVRRWREKHGDAYRAKQRGYVKAARERKRLDGGDSVAAKRAKEKIAKSSTQC